jgi:hypothetical protein
MVQNLPKTQPEVPTPLSANFQFLNQNPFKLSWEMNLLGPESLAGLKSHQLTGKISSIWVRIAEYFAPRLCWIFFEFNLPPIWKIFRRLCTPSVLAGLIIADNDNQKELTGQESSVGVPRVVNIE